DPSRFGFGEPDRSVLLGRPLHRSDQEQLQRRRAEERDRKGEEASGRGNGSNHGSFPLGAREVLRGAEELRGLQDRFASQRKRSHAGDRTREEKVSRGSEVQGPSRTGTHSER